MRASSGLQTDVDRIRSTSRGEEGKRAQWQGYNKRSETGWYSDIPQKGEHRSDTLTFPSPGRSGQLPAQTPHRPARAQLTHAVLQVIDSLSRQSA